MCKFPAGGSRFTQILVRLALCIMAVVSGACRSPSSPSSQEGALLLRDGFEAGALNPQSWFMPEGPGTFLGRTQLRPPASILSIVNGALRLQLDTYNPTATEPGDSFWGSEIVSRQTFVPGDGLIFRARVRVPDPAAGMVASFFLYRLRQGTRDEIDFEILTNSAPNGVLTNIFRDEGFTSAGSPRHDVVPGFAATDFNEFQIEWSRARVRWKVNGQVVRDETAGIPDGPMSLRLNFWAPDADFAAAYSAHIQPTPRAADNRTFFYEIDFVEVQGK